MANEDKRNSYNRLKKMLKEHKGKVFTIFELQTLIAINIGCDKRTIENAVATMGHTGLITDKGNSRFKVL